MTTSSVTSAQPDTINMPTAPYKFDTIGELIFESNSAATFDTEVSLKEAVLTDFGIEVTDEQIPHSAIVRNPEDKSKFWQLFTHKEGYLIILGTLDVDVETETDRHDWAGFTWTVFNLDSKRYSSGTYSNDWYHAMSKGRVFKYVPEGIDLAITELQTGTVDDGTEHF